MVEEDLVELLLEVVGGGGVEPGGIFEQVEGLAEVLAHEAGIGLVAGQSALDASEFSAESVLLVFEEVQGDGAGVVGLEELTALVLDVGAAHGQGADVMGAPGLDLCQLLEQVLLDQGAVLRGQADGAVDVGDTGFDLLDEHGAEGAVMAAVAPGADEVGVDGAGAVLGVLDQEPRPALTTDHGRAQEVGVDALPLTVAVRDEDVLHRLPGLGTDQRLMLPGVLHALEGDNTLVVGVPQQGVQPIGRDGFGRLTRRGRDGQPQAAQMVGQGPHRPLAGGVLGEGQAHQGRSLGVELDGANLPALSIPAAGVAVAQWGLAQGATTTRLLAHPLDDLIGQVAGVELGDAGHDAVQQHATWRLVDVLAGGDEADTRLIQHPIDLHVIRPIAGQPIQLVHDDVVDGLQRSGRPVASASARGSTSLHGRDAPASGRAARCRLHAIALLQVSQHLLQGWPVGATSRLTAIHELLDDERTDTGSLALVGGPLRGDGEALFRAASLRLLPGRHPDVRHRPLGRQGLAHRGERVCSAQGVEGRRTAGSSPELGATTRADTTGPRCAIRTCCLASTHDDLLSCLI